MSAHYDRARGIAGGFSDDVVGATDLAGRIDPEVDGDARPACSLELPAQPGAHPENRHGRRPGEVAGEDGCAPLATFVHDRETRSTRLDCPLHLDLERAGSAPEERDGAARESRKILCFASACRGAE